MTTQTKGGDGGLHAQRMARTDIGGTYICTFLEADRKLESLLPLLGDLVQLEGEVEVRTLDLAATRASSLREVERGEVMIERATQVGDQRTQHIVPP